MGHGRPPRGWRVWEDRQRRLIGLVRQAAPLLPVGLADAIEDAADACEDCGGLVCLRLDQAARGLDWSGPKAA